jgi:hypothetical protein
MMDHFEYELAKPDKSEILVKRGYDETVGKFLWNYQKHNYDFLGEKKINESELKEVVAAIKMLNVDSKIPKWLRWTRIR